MKKLPFQIALSFWHNRKRMHLQYILFHSEINDICNFLHALGISRFDQSLQSRLQAWCSMGPEPFWVLKYRFLKLQPSLVAYCFVDLGPLIVKRVNNFVTFILFRKSSNQFRDYKSWSFTHCFDLFKEFSSKKVTNWGSGMYRDSPDSTVFVCPGNRTIEKTILFGDWFSNKIAI